MNADTKKLLDELKDQGARTVKIKLTHDGCAVIASNDLVLMMTRLVRLDCGEYRLENGEWEEVI